MKQVIPATPPDRVAYQAAVVGATRLTALETRSRTEEENLKPIPDPQALPPTFPVQTASRILGIGRNRTYELMKSGDYPVRIIESGGRYRLTRWDLLKYLGATPDDTGARK